MYSIFFGLLALTAASVPLDDRGFVDDRGFITVTQAADLRTTFSDGADSVYDLTKRAEELGLDSIVINDHLLFEIEYGIFPFQHLLKYKKKLSSLQVTGVQNYFEEIKKVQEQIPGVIIIPGLEVSPFYWWSKSLFNGSITANHWEYHIGIMGMENPEVISNIPVVHNHFTIPPAKEKLIRFGILFLALIISFTCKVIYRDSKLFGFLVFVNLLLVINYFPFAGPEINIYSKPLDDIKPYQKVIDYIKDHGGISVWHHMEAINGIGKKGNINIYTPKHPEDLLKTNGFIAFQGQYEDTIHVTDPGREWDQTLMKYITGKREAPPWSLGGSDYHGVSKGGPTLWGIKNIYWVKKKSKKEIMAAMRAGRFYSVRQGKDYRLILDKFSLSSPGLKKEAISGETININGQLIVKIRISASNKKQENGTLTIIQNGNVVIEKKFTTPFEDDFAFTSIKKEVDNIGSKYNTIDDVGLNPLIDQIPKESALPLEGVSNEAETLSTNTSLSSASYDVFTLEEKPGSLSYIRLMIHGKRPNIIKTNPIFYRVKKN